MRYFRFTPPFATHPRVWLTAAMLMCGAYVAVHGQTPQPQGEAKAAAPLPSSPDPAAALELDKKVIETGKENSEVMKNLTYLSDVIGARLTGSINLRRANEWTAEVMKSYGLTNVRMEPWTIPIGWERGYATA